MAGDNPALNPDFEDGPISTNIEPQRPLATIQFPTIEPPSEYTESGMFGITNPSAFGDFETARGQAPSSPFMSSRQPISLPPPSVLRELIDIFFERIHDYIPVLHKPRFLAELNSKGPEGCSQALLFAICAVSAARHTNPGIRKLQRSWYDVARETLSKSLHFPDDVLAILQAAVIIIYQANIFTEYSTSWLLVGDAWRIAVVTGCARLDGNLRSTPLKLESQVGKSWMQKEECRRALWMLFIFDRGLCSLDLALVIDDQQLNINLPMADNIFSSEDEPIDIEPIAYTPSIDKLMDTIETEIRLGNNTNIRQFIVAAYMLLGRIGSEIYQNEFDYTKGTSVLDSLSASLKRLRLLIPQDATELSFADPRDFKLVIWLNAIMAANTIFLYHQPLRVGESPDEPSGMSKNWPHCVAASRDLVAGLRDMCRSSTDFADNAFLVSLVYAGSRILIIEYIQSSNNTTSRQPGSSSIVSSRSQNLKADTDLLYHIFRHFKVSLGCSGEQFYDAFVHSMTIDEERSRAAKAGSLLDMLRICDRWPS
uniref:Xylanolytic transcriptional activator regulatory domain-containing protein n=1 Tax=Bionectria ochroleuca TaxID=29856 RepID=A0A8H7TMW9_BIOOC